MRKLGSVAPAAASALAVALAVSAFVAGPAASAAPAVPAARSGAPAAPVPSALAAIRPGGPMTVSGTPLSAPMAFTSNTVNVVSGNWGGYVAERQGVRFRYVRAVFFVPYVDCANTPNSFSGHWVGLDGANNDTVEQDGILAACQGSAPQYSAWYEMFPKAPVYSTIPIHPGNTVVASAYYDSAAGTFTLSLTDTTSGAHFSHTEACPSGSACQRASAEVISEAPSNGTSILPLTDFRAESFSDAVVTDSHGVRAGLRGRAWDTLDVTTENPGGTVLDQPTQIYEGMSFGCYWMAAA
jgi:Peptidase A4 family